jgi:hypothetical protein
MHTRAARLQAGTLGALAGFLALAIAWTWPLAAHPASRIPNDPGDPFLNIWILWWNAHAVPFTDRWWNAPIFVPMPGALALSEHLAGLGVITTPLQLGGASPVVAYNAAFILSYALSGFFTFLLVRRLTRSPAAALVAGMACACAPYRSTQLAHIQVLTSQWMPLALLAMHAYLDGGSRRWLVVFGAAWLLQALSNGYYLLFFPVFILLWLVWFGLGPQRSRAVALAAAWIGSSLVLIPVLLKYLSVHRALGLSRSAGEMQMFSAGLRSFVTPGPALAFWQTPPLDLPEAYLFPGLTAVALVVAAGVSALRRTRDARSAHEPRPPASTLAFYAAATVMFWALAAGPAAEGAPMLARLRPYTVLLWLPGFGGLRAPARFAMLASLALAVAAGLAFHWLWRNLRKGRAALMTVVLAGLAFDGWMKPIPLLSRPGRILLPAIPGASVLELPADDLTLNVGAMFRATVHQRPLVNGYSGYTPPHYELMTTALKRGDPTVIQELAQGRSLIIIVNEELDPGRRLFDLVEGLPGVQAAGSSGAGKIYVLPAQPRARVPPAGAVWPAASRHGLTGQTEFDLGAERIVRSIELPFRWRYRELDPRMAIDVSRDGSAWTTVWEDWTGGLAVRAALAGPLEIPLRFPLNDVPARYLRLRPFAAWMERELRIIGP